MTIVEFADFECPFCQQIAPELDALWEKRKDKVRFVFKFMPLADASPRRDRGARGHRGAGCRASSGRCTTQLFANGQRLEQTRPRGVRERPRARRRALPRGHAVARGERRASRPTGSSPTTLGVKGTPTIFIDGREYDTKVDLADWLDQEIAARSG